MVYSAIFSDCESILGPVQSFTPTYVLDARLRRTRGRRSERGRSLRGRPSLRPRTEASPCHWKRIMGYFSSKSLRVVASFSLILDCLANNGAKFQFRLVLPP